LTTTLRDRAQVVEDIGQVLDPEEFRKAVELIAGAHETLVCGIAGLVLAEHAATRLTRVGYRARFVTDSGVRLVDWLLPLGPDDVVLAIAHNRFVREVRVVFEHAHSVGAKVILLTETNRPSLTEHADVVLSIPVGPVGMYGGQTPTLVVVEALSMAVAAQDEERSLNAFVTMNRLRRELEGDDRPEDEVIAPSRHNGKTSRKRLN
jgi:DNA-binding MurR/RpiR family transcriptional regulator